MRRTKSKGKVAWQATAALLAASIIWTGPMAGLVLAQSSTNFPSMPGNGGSAPHFPGMPDDGSDQMQQKAMKEQMERRNKIRQQQLVADTGKLLRLATELKAEVDKSNKDTLSLTVIKKSEEIEKLAKSVKDKMKNPM